MFELPTMHNEIARHPVGSVFACEWWHALALVLVKSVHGYGTIANVDLGLGLLLPGQTVLHPVLVIAIRVVLARVSSAGFLAIQRSFCGLYSGGEQIAELECLDQIRVPDHASIFDANIVERLVSSVHSVVYSQFESRQISCEDLLLDTLFE